MIKAGIFDVGGVLHDNSIYNATEDTAKTLGMSIEKLKLLWSEPLEELILGQITEEEFWKNVSEKIGMKKTNRTDLLTREFIAHCDLHNDVLDIVDKLKERGVKVAALSNTIKPHSDYLRNIGLYQKFDVVVLSDEIGIKKPDTGIWRYALDKLKVKPEESFYVDDIPVYVEVAKTIGIRAFQYESSKKLIEDIESLGVKIL